MGGILDNKKAAGDFSPPTASPLCSNAIKFFF